jgi:hypothetical protein
MVAAGMQEPKDRVVKNHRPEHVVANFPLPEAPTWDEHLKDFYCAPRDVPNF